MGSLPGGGKGIDESLGGLVWVRRPNGRWWPGRILGPEELPESLPSPKSGTAVKLLGREDASVDWYNVEKSSRIKAFRCGEYDECIEKAAVTAANSTKKLVKYASKEDAILHALRIERACLGNDHPSLNSKMTNRRRKVKDSPRQLHHIVEETSNIDKDSSNSENNSDSAHGLSLSSVSFEDPSYIGAYKESEDYGAKGVNHKEGLDIPGTPAIMPSKRKRFPVARVHEFLKRKHNRPTLTKKSESKILVTVPVVYEKLFHPTRSLPRGASTSKISGLCSDLPKIKFSLRDNDGSSDDELSDIPIVTEEQQCADFCSLLYNEPEKAHVSGGTKSDESSQVETVSLGESGSTSSSTAEVNYTIQGLDDSIFKWQLKRKRSRHTNKNRRPVLGKFTDLYDEFDAYVAGAEGNVDLDTFSGSQPSDNDNSRHPLKARFISEVEMDEEQGWRGNTSHKDSRDSQTSAELHAPHWESCFYTNSNYQDSMIRRHTPELLLFEVKLEVKANSRPQHVPYISLTSKLTGQSIIGHPLTVEVSEDGFCHDHITDLGWYSSSSESDEVFGNTTSAMGGVKDALDSTSNSVGQDPRRHKLQNGTPSKLRKSGFLSKNIRKLSSLTGTHEQRKKKKFIVEKGRAPSLACVPLTIVFSRLNEALNCPNRPTRRT